MYIFCPLAKTFITWEANLSLPLHIIYIVYHNIYISIYIYKSNHNPNFIQLFYRGSGTISL